MGVLVSVSLQEIYERGGGITSNSTGGALTIAGDQVITIGGSTTLTLQSNSSSYNLNAGTVALTTTAQTIIEAINEVDAAAGGATSLQAAYNAQAGAQVTGGDDFNIAVTAAVINIESTDDAVTINAGLDLTLEARSSSMTLNQVSETAILGYPDANSTRTITSLVGGLNSAVRMLCFVEGLSLTAGTTTALWAVPAGKVGVVTAAHIIGKTMTGITVAPDVSFTWSGASSGTAVSQETLTGFDTALEVYRMLVSGVSDGGAATATLNLSRNVLATATTMTVDVVVMGYIVDA